MEIEWFRGAAITVRYDEATQRVMFVANNGRVPTLVFHAEAFVTATIDGGALALTGVFDTDTKIALRLPPDDARGIARTLGVYLGLPRQPTPMTVSDLAVAPQPALVVVEGRCFPYANGPVMEGRIALLGVTVRVDHNAPYRVTGLYRRGEREEIRVIVIEHLNPPVTWFTGETVRVVHAPQRGIVGIVPVAGHRFTAPRGSLELWLPTTTLASVAIDGDGLAFTGDLSQTGYEMSV